MTPNTHTATEPIPAPASALDQDADKAVKKIVCSSHEQYQRHVLDWLEHYRDDELFLKSLDRHFEEAAMITELNLDKAIPILESIYCPTGQGAPRDPVCMLRALLLMTLHKERGITNWVARTKEKPLLAILAGFDPDDAPGIGTYYDFINRIIDGPWRKRKEGEVRRSKYNAGGHERFLKKKKGDDEKEQRRKDQSDSQKLVDKLLPAADQPRPRDYQKLLEDLLVVIGIIPSIESGLLTDLQNLVVTGDGSILETWSSPRGKSDCDCRKEDTDDCTHPKIYQTPTAQWCYDAVHNVYKFGDRYYHLVITQNGHDFPILTLMPGGNISDYTLSLESFDRFLKSNEEHDLDMNISVFCGDGHHDSHAHYQYFEAKEVKTVIPISKNSKGTYPHLSDDGPTRLDENGVPLCPGGLPMRHHQYNKARKTHVYTCPAKRMTRENGRCVYKFHESECPLSQNCSPESNIGPLFYVRTPDNQRYFPPIPRDSKKYKEIMNLRTGSERCNSVNDSYNLEAASSNADRGLVRLYFANIVHHAVIRRMENRKSGEESPMVRSLRRYSLRGSSSAKSPSSSNSP